MQKLNVMAPRNMGKTIRFGWLENDLWDVKFDESQFSVVSGTGITLKPTVLESLKQLDIASGLVTGTNLELVRVNGTKVQIALASLIPQSKQDVYLKEVSYNNQTKEIQFLVGTKSKTLHTYTVGVNALIPIIAGNGLEGDGATENPLKVKLPENSKLQSGTTGVDFAGTIELVDAFDDVHLGWFFPGSTAVENVGGGVDRPRGTPVGYEGANTHYRLLYPGRDELTDHPVVLGRIEYFVTKEDQVYTVRYRITNFYPDDPNSKIALNPTAYNVSLDYRIVVGSTHGLPQVEHTDENDPEFEEVKNYLGDAILRKGVTAEQYLQAIHDAKTYHDIDRNANEGILFTFDASKIDQLLAPILRYKDPDEYDYDVSTRYYVKTANDVVESVDGDGNRSGHDGRVIVCGAGEFNDRVEIHKGRIPTEYRDISEYYALAYDDISWSEEPQNLVFPRNQWVREDCRIEIMGKTIQVRNGVIDHVSREQLIEWFWETGQTTASVPYKVISSSGKTLHEGRMKWWDPSDEEELRERGIDFDS